MALEHFHVPKVIARIYDPRRAEIYERLNIPTVATTTWGIKQIQLMLLHDREEIRESLGGGDILRVRVPVPEPPDRQAGEHPQRRRQDPGRGRLARRHRVHPDPRQHPAGGRLPRRDDGQGRSGDARPAARAPVGASLMRVVVTGGGAIGRHLSADLAERGHDVTLIEQDRAIVDRLREEIPDVKVMLGDACEPWILEDADLSDADVVVAATGDDEDNLVTSLLAKQEFAVPRVLARVNHPATSGCSTSSGASTRRSRHRTC